MANRLSEFPTSPDLMPALSRNNTRQLLSDLAGGVPIRLSRSLLKQSTAVQMLNYKKQFSTI